jgi:glutamate dehydrogenase
MRVLHKKEVMQANSLQEEWVSNDSFNKVFNSLPFTVQADLFIPAGGRPETIDMDNYNQYFNEQGQASAKVIVEGANSFITPDGRLELLSSGVVVIRDASANKCGVISSSYEIIANLLLSDDEFLENKADYVNDVIFILNTMAEREARLIIDRYIESNNTVFCTDSSNSISREINNHYARIFDYFQENPELCNKPEYLNAMLLHMPKLIGTNDSFRGRIHGLPEKVKYAILASKLSSAMVYDADNNSLYEGMISSLLSTFPTFSAD